MAGGWVGGGRTMPPNWRQIRQERFELDCWRCVDCGHWDPSGISLECDHIGHRDDHRLEMLRTRCGKRSPNNCHGRKTSREAQARKPSRLRPPTPHPGLKKG
jgi:5-methylcytosine-specific restriction enzyme A